MRRALLLLPLLLAPLLPAGCASSGPDDGCEAAVNADPTVSALRGASAGSLTYARSHAQELRDAEANARNACLRARGLLPPGGVERRQEPRSMFEGLF